MIFPPINKQFSKNCETFAICSQDKISHLDKELIVSETYSGARVTNYGGRKLIVAYFSTKEAMENACSTNFNFPNGKFLQPYQKTAIDNDMQHKKEFSIRATYVPQEYDIETLKKIFSQCDVIIRFSLVKKDRYKIAYIVFQKTKAYNIFIKRGSFILR